MFKHKCPQTGLCTTVGGGPGWASLGHDAYRLPDTELLIDQEAESRLLAWGKFLQVSDSGEEGKVSALLLKKFKN